MQARKLYFLIGWLGLPWLWVVSSCYSPPTAGEGVHDSLWLQRTRLCACGGVIVSLTWVIIAQLQWENWSSSFMTVIPEIAETGW